MRKKTVKHRLFTRFRRYPLMGYLSKITGYIPRPDKWVFIVGSYNSGTTLLHEILSLHPQISALPDEGVMLSDQLPRPEDFKWRRMWQSCEHEMLIPSDKEFRIARDTKMQWSHFTKKNAEIILEKSVANSARMLFLERNFQPAYFIHILRNGYAVAEGIWRKAEVMTGNPFIDSKQYPIRYCIEQWKRTLEVVHRDKDQLSNFKEIRYEELTVEPTKVIDQLCEFLTIERVEDNLLQRSFSIHEKKSQIMNMNQKSIDNLTAEQINVINSIAGELLTKFNYPFIST